MEVDLRDAQDSVIELEERVGDHEAELAKEYITLLEHRFTKAIAKSIRQEGWISTLQVGLELAESRAMVAEEKVMVAEVVVRAAKGEA